MVGCKTIISSANWDPGKKWGLQNENRVFRETVVLICNKLQKLNRAKLRIFP